MDEMPNYSKYTLDQLNDVHDQVDREKYPDRYNIIIQEIEKRKSTPVLAASEVLTGNQNTTVLPANLTLKFRGSANEYFRIWIVNLCLTLLTLGIFSAWAKVRKKRYFYSHTILDGTSFQYLGQPIPILKGRVIAAVLFLLYYASSHYFTSLLPYVLAVGIVLAPWIVIRSAAFNARYSAFRNITFQFQGTYLEALKVLYFWGVIPLIVAGTLFQWWGNYKAAAAAIGLFGLTFPWWMRSLKNFLVSCTSYGKKNGAFAATAGQFFKVYFKSGLIMIGFVIVTIVLVAIPFSFFKKPHFQLILVGMVPIYVGYVMAYAYVQAHAGNLVWNHTRLGPLRFKSSLLGRGMAKLYVTNALGIIVSSGLLIPWAVMRTLKYRVDNIQVFQEGNLEDFQGSQTGAVRAVGSETLDFFDMDFSL
jgi:uncharacterized membrane protein YjgN (DUF898 family)